MNSAGSAIDRAIEDLKSGKLVVVPTETVYGLAAIVWNEEAVQNIFSLKGRPANNPLIVHIHSVSQIRQLAECSSRQIQQLKLLEIFWPGPLSVVLPKIKIVPDVVTAKTNSIAIRIPDHPLTLELLQKLNEPLAAPSANKSNYISPTKPSHVIKSFGEDCPFILDGGECKYGIESTVLSLLEESPVIMRPGSITKEDLEVVLGEPVAVHQAKSQTFSPGSSLKHYSPNTPLSLYENQSIQGKSALLKLNALITSHNEETFTYKTWLSQDGRLSEICYKLFSVLHELDQSNFDHIYIDMNLNDNILLPKTGLGTAIWDRVSRAVNHESKLLAANT